MSRRDHVLIKTMEVANEKGTLLPKNIKAIITAVVPDTASVFVLPIIESNHRGRRCDGIMVAKPFACLGQRFDFDLSGPGQLRKELNLIS